MKKLTDKPEVIQALTEVKQKIEEKKKGNNLTSVRQMLNNPDIQELLEDLISISLLREPQKKYLTAIFIKGKTPEKAVTEAFGKDIGYYQQDALIESMKDNQVVKEFLDIMKSLYIQFVPVASLKEFEMILDPMTDKKVKLDAIKDVKATAGIGAEGQKTGELPVKIVLNIGQQTNVQSTERG